NVFEILSFGKDYDVIVLKADMGGFYVCDKNNAISYKTNTEIQKLYTNNEKIITNCKNLLDFLKTHNINVLDVNMGDMVLLNYCKYLNVASDDSDVKPLYIREAQINRRNE
ncbi:MAG: hypothetical protein LBS34_03530, partial [Rickettsiales bacterium]|nr:hypothetical protein [Rickettsiales bacterium]